MALESVLLSMGLLLLFAKVLGELTERFGLSSVVGYILAGIILGPVTGLVALGSLLDTLMTFGIIVLLFLTGLEVKFDDIRHNIYMAAALAIGAGMLSFFLGMAVGLMFFNDIIVGFAIGTVLVSTSNGTLFVLLMRTKHFNTPTGRLIVATTIADDILGILALSLFTVFAANAGLDISKISTLFFIAIGLYLIVLTAGEKIVKQVVRLFGKFHDEQILLAVPLILTFLFAYFTQQLELSMAAGAFLAGMTMANTDVTVPVIEPKAKLLGNSFLIPLFYAAIGTLLVIKDVNVVLVSAILLAAVLGKFIGSAAVARLAGFTGHEIKIIGISLIPRGNENIALAQLVFVLGLISSNVYTSVIFAMIGTVVLTPVLMKVFYD